LEAPLTERVILADALGAGVLGCPIMEMELATGAGVSTGADLAVFPVKTRLLVLFAVGFTVTPVVDLYNVGAGGWVAAGAGVTVTQVPDNGLEALALTSTPAGLTDTEEGLAGRVAIESLFTHENTNTILYKISVVIRF